MSLVYPALPMQPIRILSVAEQTAENLRTGLRVALRGSEAGSLVALSGDVSAVLV